MSVAAAIGKDLAPDWPTGMFDYFLHRLVTGSLPS